MDKRTAEEIQAERDRQSAEYELSLSRVKPIQSDYQWFAQDAMNKKNEGVPSSIENDLFLKNSYLNGRLKHVWEHMEQEDRMEFLKREEADRRRFTEEEEVASRHCATLTARAPAGSSPNRSSTAIKDKGGARASPTSYSNNNGSSSSPEKRASRPTALERMEESPNKRNKLEHPPFLETSVSTAPESSSGEMESKAI